MYRHLVVLGLLFFGAGCAFGLSGGGVEDDPWVIGSLADFDEFAGDPNYWDDYTRLETDIDLWGKTYTAAVIAPDTSNYYPGYQGTAFTGVFDGCGHQISKLTIDTLVDGEPENDRADYLGLFGWIKGGGEVLNLGVECTGVTAGHGSYYTGCLCGYNAGSITNCYSTGPITGHYSTGGFCSFNGGSIENCYSTGTVFCEDSILGIGGLCANNRGTIVNCYSSGLVSSGDGSSEPAGMCGYNDKGVVSNCFWDIETSGQVTSSGGYSKTTLQMRQKATFIGWNNGAWTINEGYDYPRLVWENKPGKVIDYVYPRSYTGDGKGEPFQIATSQDIFCLSRRPDDWDKAFILVCDIDMEGIDDYWPISNFSGFMDGDGHVINNLTIDSALIGNRSQLGLFGKLNTGGEIINLGLASATVTGCAYSGLIGSLCGDNRNGTISNCFSTGIVIGGSNSLSLGGLCGGNFSGSITDCYSSCSVTSWDSSREIGGLCGITWGGLIVNCNSDGSVSGENSSSLGGLCGTSNAGSITNCYFTGKVSGGGASGGLCGYVLSGTEITSCYATGTVSGGGILGGLCGHNSSGIIDNCYASCTVTTEDYSTAVGGLCGLNERSISNSYATGTVSGLGAFFGGFCGDQSGIISNCYAICDVDAGSSGAIAGGLCGNNYGTINDCYASGSIKGDRKLGGLCGRNFEGTINNCYASGLVTGTSQFGGLCGENSGGLVIGRISNCFWDVESSGVGLAGDDNFGATGKTTLQMQTGSTFTLTGWDFDSGDGDVADWMMLREGEDYPRLVWQEIFAGDIGGLYGVDWVDFGELAFYWGESCSGGCADGDIDGDGSVGIGDLVYMVDGWGELFN